MKNNQPSKPPFSVGRMLNLISRRLNAQMEVRLQELGLTLNGFFILMTLTDSDGLTQSALGKRLNLPPYGITRLIDSMHAEGLVERRDDPTSRRNHLIFRMERGKTIAPEVRVIIEQVNGQLLAGLTPTERQAFTTILGKLT